MAEQIAGSEELWRILLAAEPMTATALQRVEQLLDAQPRIASAAAAAGWLPLHEAACRQASDATTGATLISVLARAHPAAAMAPTAQGCLPLHLAAHYQCFSTPAGAAVVSALLDAAPQAAMVSEATGALPLHIAAQFQAGDTAGLQLFTRLIQAAPAAVHVPDEHGCLPLHFAAQDQGGQRGTGLVEALLRAAPDTAMQGNVAGSLPLHVAAAHQGGERGTAVVELLLKAAPQAALTAQQDGQLPLHIAASSQGGERGAVVVEVLLKAELQAALVADNRGWLPLHVAAVEQGGERGAAVIRSLVAAVPDAALKGAESGFLPLHFAACFQGGERGAAVVEALLKAVPEAALTPKQDGWLPLHTAAFFQGGAQGTSVAELLLQLAPTTISATTNDGHTPLDLATARTEPNFHVANVAQLSVKDPLISLLREALRGQPVANRSPTSLTSSRPANGSRPRSAISLSQQSPTLDQSGYEVFISGRFCEARSHGLALQRSLQALGHSAFFCDVQPGDDIASAIIHALHDCHLVVILGTETYGKKTDTSFSTFEELRYICDRHKPFFLVKMCEEFLERETLFRLTNDIAYYPWRPAGKADAPPAALVESIERKLLQVRNAELRGSDRRVVAATNVAGMAGNLGGASRATVTPATALGTVTPAPVTPAPPAAVGTVTPAPALGMHSAGSDLAPQEIIKVNPLLAWLNDKELGDLAGPLVKLEVETLPDAIFAVKEGLLDEDGLTELGINRIRARRFLSLMWKM